jgi:hypothetical protein
LVVIPRHPQVEREVAVRERLVQPIEEPGAFGGVPGGGFGAVSIGCVNAQFSRAAMEGTGGTT